MQACKSAVLMSSGKNEYKLVLNYTSSWGTGSSRQFDVVRMRREFHLYGTASRRAVKTFRSIAELDDHILRSTGARLTKR